MKCVPVYGYFHWSKFLCTGTYTERYFIAEIRKNLHTIRSIQPRWTGHIAACV